MGGASLDLTNGETATPSFRSPGDSTKLTFKLTVTDNKEAIASDTVVVTVKKITPKTLTISKNGNGKVTSSPEGIDCGNNCSTSFIAGTKVTLTATPDADSVFSSWRGGGCSGSGTCKVTMNTDQSVTAKFTLKPTFALKVTKTGTGKGSVVSNPAGINCEPTTSTCTYNFDRGKPVTLTATPDANSVFDGWSGSLCKGTGVCKVTMITAKSVSAKFTLKPTLALTVKKTGNGAGSLSSDPQGINCGNTCNYNFASGTQVTLNATADSGSVFTSWDIDCVGSGGCIVPMNSAKTVSANFDTLPTFSVTVTKAGNGTITSAPAGISCGATCSASFVSATSVTLTAKPDTGYSFTGWSNGCTGTVTTCTVNVTQALQIDAVFTKKPPFISKLNDTGIATCATYNEVGLACPQSNYPRQDAELGRDATLNDNSDGQAGFSFTKISSTGTELAASDTNWSCVQDNVTGLMWEVKTDDGGLHDKDWTYSWYDSNNARNGGTAGRQNGSGNCSGSQCDTADFVAIVNAVGWCGANDWRTPTKEELRSITSYNRIAPAIDVNYFPNTPANGEYASASSFANDSTFAWISYLNTGQISPFSKISNVGGGFYNSFSVRLVRDGQ
ncbi:hypothetical protein CRENPOLYSF2_1470009 [Crenothrix polyspora]|uniref:Bacterial repeat domain-containing protein n=1 Tax=Crenothrix polyspora TaxID=360316 RepID=A0A1R4H1I9_9GAMM|nr:hypothetical protein CRENPOLYSF2_1470009 [Crenothrix polyspora]